MQRVDSADYTKHFRYLLNFHLKNLGIEVLRVSLSQRKQKTLAGRSPLNSFNYTHGQAPTELLKSSMQTTSQTACTESQHLYLTFACARVPLER